MLSRYFAPVTFVAVILLAAWSVAAADLATYREFTLGASTADVIARTGAAQRDVKKLHERPALLEELSWRKGYTSARNSAADRDSVAAIVFSFVDDQLFRMAIDYDRSRTEGLTKEDMIASFSEIYGPRLTRAPAVPRPAFDSLDTQAVLASWKQGDTTVTLYQTTYSGGFGLVITSVPLEALARKAQATSVTMDAREAPAREAARAKEQADAARAAAEKTRTANKAVFKP